MIEKYHSLIHKYKKMNSKFEKAQAYTEKKYNIMYLEKDQFFFKHCDNIFMNNVASLERSFHEKNIFYYNTIINTNRLQ